VVGLGRIGTAAARRAHAHDMVVCFYDPYLPDGAELGLGFERAGSLQDLLPQSDVVSLHCGAPATPESTGTGLQGCHAAVQISVMRGRPDRSRRRRASDRR
jgi:phosphoglycerate dehydrogenase-like enzyme